jgi:hypothetical protein
VLLLNEHHVVVVVVVVVYFIMDSVQKLLDTPSYTRKSNMAKEFKLYIHIRLMYRQGI